jgi:WD40 repeat protein
VGVGGFVTIEKYDTVRLWDVATGAARGTLKGHSGGVNAVTFSPDGQLVASASHDKTVRLWDVAMGTALRTLMGHSGSVKAVTFSPGRSTGGFGIGRQHGQALGCGNGSGPSHARRRCLDY